MADVCVNIRCDRRHTETTDVLSSAYDGRRATANRFLKGETPVRANRFQRGRMAVRAKRSTVRTWPPVEATIVKGPLSLGPRKVTRVDQAWFSPPAETQQDEPSGL